MKRIACATLAFVLLVGAASPDAGLEWVHSLPGALAETPWRDVPKESVFEVVASKERSAVLGELQAKRFAALEASAAQYYTGPYFKCSKDQKPYLVRAIYQNGGTGAYIVRVVSGALLVIHGSLGKTESLSKSALVVCLTSEPSDVYNQLVGAE